MDINLVDFYARLGTMIVIIVLGFFLGKSKWISTQTNKQLVNLLLMVFMPAALFSAFPATYSADSLRMFLDGLLGGVIVMLILIVASRIIFNKWFYKGEIRYESQFALIFNNATFLGYPIVATTFGETGLIPYCGFIIAFNIALFSYGVYLFQRKLNWQLIRGMLLNPNIIAVLLGMGVFLLQLQVPSVLGSAVDITAGATTPLSLIAIGFMLSHAHLAKLIRKWRLVLTAIIQLTVGPLLTFAVLSMISMPHEVIVICTLIQALPTATSLGLFAAKYGGNDIESSELVAISTLLSTATLPVIVLLLFG